MTVGAMMEKIAGEWPDRVALVEGVADRAKRRRWTFRQLVNQSKALARRAGEAVRGWRPSRTSGH
jgi:fatty-acyl-CoA synthase